MLQDGRTEMFVSPIWTCLCGVSHYFIISTITPPRWWPTNFTLDCIWQEFLYDSILSFLIPTSTSCSVYIFLFCQSTDQIIQGYYHPFPQRGWCTYISRASLVWTSKVSIEHANTETLTSTVCNRASRVSLVLSFEFWGLSDYVDYCALRASSGTLMDEVMWHMRLTWCLTMTMYHVSYAWTETQASTAPSYYFKSTLLGTALSGRVRWRVGVWVGLRGASARRYNRINDMPRHILMILSQPSIRLLWVFGALMNNVEWRLPFTRDLNEVRVWHDEEGDKGVY